MKTALLLSVTMLLATVTHGQSMEDVIYKTDGSILRGSIIEQDFTNKRYRIQLKGGSIFGVAETDIQKITKEPVFTSPQTLVASTPITAIQPEAQAPSQMPMQSLMPQPDPISSVLHIGTLGHNIHYPIDGFFEDRERVERYTGARLAMELIHSDHIATRYGLEGGSLDTVEIIDSNNNVLDEFEASYEKDYMGVDASVILSTNLQKGWQFHTGLGIFNHIYITDNESEQFTGSQIEIGLGYSWENVQLGFQLEGMMSSDYPDEVDSQTSATLQLGFNFR